MKAKRKKGMSIADAMRELCVEDFTKRIIGSSSRGELFHVFDYLNIAKMRGDKSWFRPFLLRVVEYAEKNWERPESCFQHIFEFLKRDKDAAEGYMKLVAPKGGYK